MRCVIFGAAPLGCAEYVNRYLRPDDRVLCADGGLRHALKLGLSPIALIGDGDSGGCNPPPGAEQVSMPTEKDMTDVQACMDYGLARGMTDFLLFGCTGGPRFDHFVGNLFLLEYCAGRGGRAVMADDDHEFLLHTGGCLTFEDYDAFDFISVIPLDGSVTRVRLRGLKYPLDDAMLTRGETLGLSNEPTGDGPIRITLSGRAFVVRAGRRM